MSRTSRSAPRSPTSIANLLEYTGDDTLPQDPEGYGQEVWFENFLDACGSMYTRERLIAFPYDCAVACTFYRQDLFEQHGKDFEKEYGYRMEFTPETTWKQLYEFAAFFKKLRDAGQDVPYGYAQHQGSFAWTTQLDIQRMLFSHGQWTEFDVDDKLGSKTPGPTNWGDEQSVLIMQKFKEQAEVSHPDNLANGTLQLNTVYQAGQIAMQVQYHEFAASIEDEKTSRAAGGKTAYAPCPKGEKSWLVGDGQLVNGTNCGIGGIGINGNASDDLKRAAYIFSIWATSKDTQFNVLAGVGGTPTRKSVLADPRGGGRAQPADDHAQRADLRRRLRFRHQGPATSSSGPKIPEANEYHQIILDGVQKCISGKDDARGGLPVDQGEDRRPERRLSMQAIGGGRHGHEHLAAAARPCPAAGGVLLPADRALHRARGRAHHRLRPASAQPDAVAALLSLPDAAGDRRAGRRSRSTRSSGSST